MKAMILCAGLGTRLGEHTQKTPKAMLDIGGEPLLAHTIRLLAGFGFTDIGINLHFEPTQIESYFKNGENFNVKITYFYEEKLLGTGGGVKNAEFFLKSAENFLVIYGDIFTNQNLGDLYDFHLKNGGLATLLLHKRIGSNSVVNVDDKMKIVKFLERPKSVSKAESVESFVNSGVQVLNRRIFDFMVQNQFYDLASDIYQRVIPAEDLFGFVLTGRRVAIDSPQRYRLAQGLQKELLNTKLGN